MDDALVKTVFEKETCRMVQGEMVLLKGVSVELCIICRESLLVMGEIFPLFLILELMKKNPTISGENTMLWHQILGHIGDKGLQLPHGKCMVEGMSNYSLDFDFCEHCLYGKKNRVRFPSGATRAEGILHLVHSDVFGPLSVPSF